MMSTQTEIIALSQLEFLPYLNENGLISENLQNKIGVYAIFDGEKELQFVGYSRDIYLSLRQHLIRQPNNCYWVKLQTIERPSRTILEEIRQAWIAENGQIPMGNEALENEWTQPIDAKLMMTDADKEQYHKNDELGQIKLLKNIARRVESAIKEQVKNRGFQEEVHFNPKLKEQGLLDLK